jgi:hypothetical protein
MELPGAGLVLASVLGTSVRKMETAWTVIPLLLIAVFV